MDSTEFLAAVNWETTIYDVVLISEETEENPAVWECRIKPKDYNDIGSDIPVELDFQLIDNAGHVFRIINKDKYSTEKRVEVTDIFRVWPECPHPDLTGFVCKTVGDGEAPHVIPAMLDRLDDKAKDYLQSIEKDILWRYPKDINEKWHPEGLVFSIDTTNNKLIKWTAGKFVITKWPEGLESEYRIENVINKSAYHPERKYNINSGTFTCDDDELYYIYAVVPTAKNELSGSIVIEKTYRFERYYSGMITILMGVYTIPDADGKRSFVMQWSGGDGSVKNVTIIENHTTLTNIISNIVYYDTTLQQFISYINNEWIIIGGGNNVISGDGMDFETNTPVTLGLPSEVNSTTVNEVTATSHTHKLGNIDIGNITKADINYIEYGALYNWYVTTDVKKITSSDDWDTPIWADWQTLRDYVGESVFADVLRELGITHWEAENGATNQYEFNSVGAGTRHRASGICGNLKKWNTFNVKDSTGGFFGFITIDYLFDFYNGEVGDETYKSQGTSVRYVRPATTEDLLLADGTYCNPYVGNDGKSYKTVKIGTQVWLAENLNETQWRDHSWIEGYNGGVYMPISNSDWVSRGTTGESLMCYYEDIEANGGGQKPLADLLISEHNKLKGLQGGDAENDEFYHLTAAEKEALSDNSCEFSFLFETAEAFTFVCPHALKFTSMTHQQTNAPTLSVALDTNMAQFDSLVITPDATGLVILTGTYL